MIADLDRLLDVTSLVRREAFRRDAGEERDPRFDVPITVLLDLGDDLLPAAADVDRYVQHLHGLDDDDERALLDNCTNDAACEARMHLSTCPRRQR